MEDDQNGGAAVVVVAQPPSSETCGTNVNHGASHPPPSSVAAPEPAVFGCPTRSAPSYGAHLNNNNNNPVIKGQQQQQQQQHKLKGPGISEHRTRRPRRGKRKNKKLTPYLKNNRMFRYKALAPNNTNQFLMDDHNDVPDIDRKISARYNENGRTRNSSYTSVESDGEHIYSSSSDDDGTMIQKEFIDTYRLVQEEQLERLSRNELIQRVIELEEKIQVLESKRYRQNIMTYLNDTSQEDGEELIDPEEHRSLKIQLRELTALNKKQQTEIETLKQVQTRTNDSDSSVDSESSSDSSDSSSSSSDGQEIEMKFLLRRSGSRDDHATKDD